MMKNYSLRSQKTLAETEKKLTDAINNTEIKSNKIISNFLISQNTNRNYSKNKNAKNSLYAKNLKNSFNQAVIDNSKRTNLDTSQKSGLNSNRNFNLKSNESPNQRDNTMRINVRRRNYGNDGNVGGKIMVQKNYKIENRGRTRK